MFKNYIQKRLEKYVERYFAAHPEVKLVAIAGSVGKTSTKTATATLLSKKYRVGMSDSNHNTHMSAPLSILGIAYPSNIRSIGAWISVFRAAKARIKQPATVDVIVQELGSDRPGEIAHFMTYLKPDIGLVSAVTPEHMEFFETIEKVAEEELSLANGSQLAIINRDDIDGRFANFITNQNISTYGTSGVAEYKIETEDFDINHGYQALLIAPEIDDKALANVRVFGEHSLRPVAGAMAVALKLGVPVADIISGVEDVTPVPGRMNVLRGVQGSILIDDTYNSSPVAASAALQALYGLQAPQRIAILGSMNELGSSSQPEHEKLGNLCDPSLLAWVITVGEEAEKYLAPAAKARGCQVKTFRTAIEAGAFANSVIEQDAVVLAKGSEGGIYLEEAIKILLHETADDKYLVRQSDTWQAKKQDFFSYFS